MSELFENQYSGEPVEASQIMHNHHKVPRAEGGEYTEENIVPMSPTEHMKLHNIYRERHPELEELKSLVDDRNHWTAAQIKIKNQFRAVSMGTDSILKTSQEDCNAVLDLIESAKKRREKAIEKWIKEHYQDYPIAQAMLSVPYVSYLAVADFLVYIDIYKCPHPSSLWAYIYGRTMNAMTRHSKGVKGGGNKALRSRCYIMGGNFIKSRPKKNPSPYLPIYDRTKMQLVNSNKMRTERTKRGDRTKYGATRTVPWREAYPNDRHMAAIRKMMKFYLADAWFVWRTLEGLPTEDLYVKEHLGHERATIDPRRRGWVF